MNESHPFDRWMGDGQVSLKEGSYALRELLDPDGRAFIANAYRAILGREPDADGLRSQLDDLRRAQATKTDVLGRLRFSAEGRVRGVAVKGLFPRYLLRRAYRVPALGYALQWLTTALRLPSVVRRQDGFEARVHVLLEELRQHLLETESEIAQAVAQLRVEIAEPVAQLRAAVDEAVKQLRAEIVEAVAQLRAEADALARRADIQEVRTRDATIESADLQGTITARLGKLERLVLGGVTPSPAENAVYDAQTVAVMRRCLRPNSNGIDVGCHEGRILDYLLAIACEGTHFAFEPLPRCCRHVRDRFAWYPKLHVFEVALSDTSGESLFQHVVNCPAYSGLRRRRYDIPDARIEEVRVRTDRLDRLVPAGVRIDFVKIDVEGAELQVLRGAEETLRRWKPIVVFEHGLGAADYYGSTPEELWDLFAQSGLCASLMERWLRGEDPLRREEFAEQFRNGWNYYFIAHP